jgi:hypothetical protein
VIDLSQCQDPIRWIGIFCAASDRHHVQQALEGAVATLPHPVSSAHVRSIAETILRSAQEGEQDPETLRRLALLELEIFPR